MSEKLAPSLPNQPKHDQVELSQAEIDSFYEMADPDNYAKTADTAEGTTPSRPSTEHMSTAETKKHIEELVKELGIPETPRYDDPNKDDARYQFKNQSVDNSPLVDPKEEQAEVSEPYAAEANEDETSYEIGQEVVVRRNVYKNGQIDASVQGPLESGWIVRGTAPDGSYILGKDGLTHDGKPGKLTKVVDAETIKNWQADYSEQDDRAEQAKEDEAYAENARRGAPNRMNPNQPSLDSMERVTGPESVDFNTRIGSQADRISQWLGDKAEKYENAGGIKGLAKKALRRLGSAAYRRSGLKASVKGTKNLARKTGEATDRAADKIDAFAGRVEDAVYRPIDYLRTKRDEALKRAAIRARERAAQQARHEQIKREQQQARREKEVLDYVASMEDGDENESSIDLKAEVNKRRGEARGKHRKANERKERRAKAMRAFREQLGETSREMWDTSRTKQLGSAVARYSRKAKNVAKGAATGAIDGARAGARL